MKLVCQKLADRADTAVTEVVAVVDMSLSVFDLYQIFCRFYNVFIGQNRYVFRHLKRQLVVHFHTTHTRQVVSFRIKE